MIRKFRKTKSTAGFDKVNVDKMFAISGGSLTAWGRSIIGVGTPGNTWGYYGYENVQVYTGTIRKAITLQSSGRTIYVDEAQYVTRQQRYWYFPSHYISRAGCTKAPY